MEKDPDDDKFMECTAVLNARYIITGDKALRDIEDYMGIKVAPQRNSSHYTTLRAVLKDKYIDLL